MTKETQKVKLMCLSLGTTTLWLWVVPCCIGSSCCPHMVLYVPYGQHVCDRGLEKVPSSFLECPNESLLDH